MSSTEKPMVKATNIHKVFSKDLHVLRGIDLEVNKGETVVILGASGSGKSTLLRCINFLEEPTAGTVEVDNIVIDAGAKDKQREERILDIRKRTGMCFQSFNLFPHMNVIENIIERTNHCAWPGKTESDSLCRRAS